MAGEVAADRQAPGAERIELSGVWQAARGTGASPADLDALDWIDAPVPGTAAGALRAAGLLSGDPPDLDAEEWWFRTSFAAAPVQPDEEAVLEFGGIATVAEVLLNGEPLLVTESMFASHRIDVSTRLREENELIVRCLPLAPLLRERRKPRARWRTRVVAEGNLRFFRTMLLGRAPGFAPGPATVGPWREIALERRRGVAFDSVSVRTELEGSTGRLTVEGRLRALGGAVLEEVQAELTGPSGAHAVALELSPDGDGVLGVGELDVPDVALWWPHTHGEQALHGVRLVARAGGSQVASEVRRVGFRSIAPGAVADHSIEADGLALHVNGTSVFVRGAVWTPVDPVGMAPSREELRATLERARDGGFNMVRVVGTAAYESEDFHDLCDELGMLVWQDFMFANLDYPVADESFRATVEAEAAEVLARLGHRPSLAVLCGNSEIEQQVGMLGLDLEAARGELFGELLPAARDTAKVDAIYVPSAPYGGELPFRNDRGIANYFGVGGYMRPLEDARRAGVRFASECLAIANVPDAEVVESLLPASPQGPGLHDPAWKRGVPRDSGAGWDFDDVRDHYLGELFDVDPVELRSSDRERYLELSRTVSGEVMAEVFGEWRRAASGCGGGIILWLRDLMPGAGWGLLDHRGEPKVAWHHLRRALAPVAVWLSDEGLGGYVAHVANDLPTPLEAVLRVRTYRDRESLVEAGEEVVSLGPHSGAARNLESVLGRFADLTWAYRFGPPAQDVVVASLLTPGESGELLSQAFRFPAGRPIEMETPASLGLEGSVSAQADGTADLAVRSRMLAYGVRAHVPGFDAADDAFSLEPGQERRIALRPREPGTELSRGRLTAVNLSGHVNVEPTGGER